MIKFAAIGLIVLGVLALASQGFTYTETKKDAEIGPITIQHDETKTIPLTSVVGGVLVAAGVAALLMGNRRNIN